MLFLRKKVPTSYTFSAVINNAKTAFEFERRKNASGRVEGGSTKEMCEFSRSSSRKQLFPSPLTHCAPRGKTHSGAFIQTKAIGRHRGRRPSPHAAALPRSCSGRQSAREARNNNAARDSPFSLETAAARGRKKRATRPVPSGVGRSDCGSAPVVCALP